MTVMNNQPESEPRLNPAIRWDFLLALSRPTDEDCLRAYASEDGVDALADYPNIVARAAKLMPSLPPVLSTMPAGLVAMAVRAALSGEDISASQALNAVDGLFG
jgi:hypothetical protein